VLLRQAVRCGAVAFMVSFFTVFLRVGGVVRKKMGGGKNIESSRKN